MFKFIFAAALAVTPFLAQADEGGGSSSSGGSEFFYQTEAGKQAVTPSLKYSQEKQKGKGFAESKISGFVIRGEYEYGLMPEMSLGGALQYTSAKTTQSGATDTKQTGLNDLEVFVKGGMPAGPGSFKFGGTLSISPGDSEVKTNGDTNGYSGRMALSPYVGYEYNMSPCTFGAKLAVDVGLTDATTKTGSVKTKTSGNEDTTITLFYEHEMSSDMKLGASLDWTTTTDTKNESAGGGKSENISPTQELDVYLPMKMGEGTLIPRFAYGFTTDSKVNGVDIDNDTTMALSAAYRMNF